MLEALDTDAPVLVAVVLADANDVKFPPVAPGPDPPVPVAVEFKLAPGAAAEELLKRFEDALPPPPPPPPLAPVGLAAQGLASKKT